MRFVQQRLGWQRTLLAVGDGPCSTTRLEVADGPVLIDPVGYRFIGCWQVRLDGAGYRADHLDIEFTHVSEAPCAGR